MADVVRVSFLVEASDPDDPTGLTQEDYDDITQGVAHLGGYDIDTEIQNDDASNG